ncbi:MAG: diguanylate cyclase [bacterium]|jgi:diguanylate cyclase (GGDEF)-like protein
MADERRPLSAVLDAGLRSLEPVDWMFAMLRAAAVLAVAIWAVFHPDLESMDRAVLAGVVALFTVYSAVVSVLGILRPGRIFKLARFTLVFDILFVEAVVLVTGGITKSLFYLGFFLVVPLYALHFGFRMGLYGALLAIVAYTAPAGAGVMRLPFLDSILKLGVFLSILFATGYLRRRQALASERLQRLTEEVEQKNRMLAHKTMAERNRIHELYALNKVGKLITSALDTRELFSHILAAVSTELHFKHFCLWIYDESSNALVLKAVQGLPQEAVDNVIVEPGAGVEGACLERGTPQLIHDLSKVEAFNYLDSYLPGAKCAMCVPVMIRRQCAGVVSVYSEHEDSFNEERLEVLSALGEQVAVALENSQLYSQMRYLTMQDGLTHLYNRRFFNDQIAIECERAEAGKGDFALLLVDVDHFKLVNDELGHLTGDEVLRQVAKVLLGRTRQTDFVCRYGGEEFAIILHNLDKRSARERAERLRKAVEAEVRAGSDSGARAVTISIGIAHYEPGMSQDKIIELADKGLYLAKERGRNRVEAA